METKYCKSRVAWWVYAVVIFTMAYCLGFAICFDSYALMVPLGVAFAVLEIVAFCSVKYAIRGNELGVRGMNYGWTWYPIDKITEARKRSGILSASALSTRRIAIRFSDRKILKSSSPLEISPEDRDAFLAELLSVNPNIML